MKKLESTWYNMLAVLTIISVIAGGALAYVNQLTEGPIKEIKEKQLADGIKAVLGGQELTVEQTEETADGAIIYTTTAGKAVQVSGNGFGGTLKVLVGFAADGSILGYQILEHAETPGLGAKAQDWFQEGQKGNIIGKNPATPLTVSKDGGDVDAITASTITSRAFLNCVNAAYKALGGAAEADAESGASPQN